MEEKNGLYTIGQMASSCKVSSKQLRYYDEKGILSPAFKDPVTMYRYYTRSQVYEVLLLKELRNMDIPLKDVADILKARDMQHLRGKLTDQLKVAREHVKQAMLRYNQMVEMYARVTEAMDVLERSDQSMQTEEDCQLLDLEAKWVVSTRYVSPWNVQQLFTERRAEVFRLLDDYDLEGNGVISAIFHGGYLKQFSFLEEDEEGDFEVCMEIESPRDCPNCRRIEAFQAVSAIHVGPYPDLIRTYEAMEKWAQKQGIPLMELSIEEYLCGASMTTDPMKYVTRIYIPVRGSKI